MIQLFYDFLLELNVPLMRSPVFFLFIAQTTQFSLCLLFSVNDLNLGRVPKERMIIPALNGALGFIPFIVLWWWKSDSWKQTQLPDAAPSLTRLITEIIVFTLIGDFFHYLTHRLLHYNLLLRTHIHSVHHEYEGRLFSWIGMQVHPIEALMINIAIYTPLVLFAHPLSLWILSLGATINAAFAHSGYNGGFSTIGLPYALTSSDHQLHHEKNSSKNFGNIFSIWDRMFGTFKKTESYNL